MSTPGFDPYQVLWHLFQADDAIVAHLPLFNPQRDKIKAIVTTVTENRLHPEGSSLVGRFLKLMADANGKTLTAEQADLAEGMLECLNPYQSYEPYSRPESPSFNAPGIWDHFKGGVYLKTGHGSWASGSGELTVEYLSMLFGTKHYRLAEHWCEVVRWPDGKYRSRFVYRGPDLKTAEPSFKVPSPTTPH